MPNVWGLKDSSGEIGYIKEVLAPVADKQEFSVLVGPEHLLAEVLQCGAHGGVPGGANIFHNLAIYLTPPTPTSSALGCGRGLSQDVA